MRFFCSNTYYNICTSFLLMRLKERKKRIREEKKIIKSISRGFSWLSPPNFYPLIQKLSLALQSLYIACGSNILLLYKSRGNRLSSSSFIIQAKAGRQCLKRVKQCFKRMCHGGRLMVSQKFTSRRLSVSLKTLIRIMHSLS